ncbi:hypothetical protein BU25DRAFT_456653 [Macroventuria anomochaeta]|uniref:Uncharacterized protein n=1 Tax=Macroventuria anomochaeta TaxID=301207 RepID=A0ACB6S5Q1_9PLEO|nr:uncharacterized protein BU25DRAFT_456653 [Macroventuria anomochaeta]KAF2629565.1 hypothetical protein BU25DRAFT_456653 [Macroventuria anomochaeta]
MSPNFHAAPRHKGQWITALTSTPLNGYKSETLTACSRPHHIDMVISRATLQRSSTDVTQPTYDMSGNNDTDNTHTMLPTPDVTSEKHKQANKITDTEVLDDLFDYTEQEQEEEQELKPKQEGEFDQGQKQEQTQEPVTTPQASTKSNMLEAVMIGNAIRGSLCSTAVKRKHDDVDEIGLTHDTSVENSLVQQKQDPEAIRAEATASSPLPSHQPSSSPQAAYGMADTAPRSPAPQPQPELRKMPVPLPNMSNAPPSLKPMKKPQPRKKKPRAPPAKKQPKTHTPAPEPEDQSAPNSALSDSDPAKLWCTCRQTYSGKHMVACDADPKCEIGWFHFRCAGLVKSPAAKEWYCAEHRGRARGVARAKRRKTDTEGARTGRRKAKTTERAKRAGRLGGLEGTMQRGAREMYQTQGRRRKRG